MNMLNQPWKQSVIAAIIIISFILSGLILKLFLPNLFDVQQYQVGAIWLGISGGFLGGGIYMARGFYQSIISQDFPFDFERFGWWYLFRLLLGGTAGGLTALIAFLGLDLQDSNKNLMSFFFLGVLAGYNFTYFINNRITKSDT